MNDLLLVALWSVLLGAALGGAAWLHRRGVASTSLRDLLHVGAGLWVLGWGAFSGPAAPVGLTAAATAVALAIPRLASHSKAAAAILGSITNADERWRGVALYTVSCTVLTAAAWWRGPLASAVALWALALGDGLGGAIGRRLGVVAYQLPGGTPKTLEGSLAVGLFAAAGAALAMAWHGAPIAAVPVATAGLVAAVAEAVAPRSTDNLLVPASVWLIWTAPGYPT